MDVNTVAAVWLVEPGHSKQALADALGISYRALQYRLTGRGKWKWDEVLALAELCGVDVGELAEAERE